MKISLEKDVSTSHNYWDDVILIHNALPEINLDDIDFIWRKKRNMKD